MKHRFASVAVLALVVGGGNPAFALTRLAGFEWAPATGPVAGYAIYASIGGGVEELVAAVALPSAIVAVESSTYVTLRVAAYDSAGRLGPSSDLSDSVRLCPGDFDGDEITGVADVIDVRSCFGQAAEGFCAGADFDLDGWVGNFDTGRAGSALGADACALAGAPATCPGDFDGDHLIGIGDLSHARSCFGQPAQGACAAGDFDGNGIVAMFDISSLQRALGSNACAQ